MVDYIYRAKIHNDGERITYRNSNGKFVTYSPEGTFCDYGRQNNQRDAILLFSTINKYFTGKDPNITPQEQVKIRADIAKARAPIDGIKTKNAESLLDIFGGIDFALKTFSDKNSEGGENITPNEVYQMFEMFHTWTSGNVWK